MSDNNYIELIDESIVKAINDFKQEEYLIRKSNSTPELNKLWFKKEKQANLVNTNSHLFLLIIYLNLIFSL